MDASFHLRRLKNGAYCLGVAYLPPLGVSEVTSDPSGVELALMPGGAPGYIDPRADSIANCLLSALAHQQVTCWQAEEAELLRDLCRASDVSWHGAAHVRVLELESTLRHADITVATEHYGLPRNWRGSGPTPKQAAVLVARIVRELARRAAGGAA